jgi:hypothetical protein
VAFARPHQRGPELPSKECEQALEEELTLLRAEVELVLVPERRLMVVGEEHRLGIDTLRDWDKPNPENDGADRGAREQLRRRDRPRTRRPRLACA